MEGTGERAIKDGRPRAHATLLGKTVIVDVSYTATKSLGPALRRQFYGVVTDVTGRNAVLRLRCGGSLDLPPETSLYSAAPQGAHRLRSTGEYVPSADLFIAFSTTGTYGAGLLRAVAEPR